MLVADPLDPVVAEAVPEEGGALEGLRGDGLHARELRLQVVARGDRPGAAGGADPGREARLRPAHRGVGLLDGGTGHVVVPDRVPELLELVEDHVLGVLLQLPALVVDLLHVALAARGRDDLGTDLAKPREALLGHVLGEDRDRGAAEDRRVERAATAVVPGRGPDGLVLLGVELAADEPRDEAGEGRADLVGARREVLPDEADDPGLHPGDLSRDLEIVDPAEEPRLVVVLPVDPEEVRRGSRPRGRRPSASPSPTPGRGTGRASARRWG